ncbi:hypothetical protein [Phenylobacterium sp.]|uniref:hypothetical protein n=1 Tax=Phenylobacterium sp. TaxID=1871053 RepID=UPI002FCC9768
MSFDTEWARCAPWIGAALEHAGRTHSLADVKAMVEARECRFWAGREAAMVTEIIEHPQSTDLMLWLAGGDLDELKNELRPMAEAWGREHDCKRSLIVGRDGWVRALRDEGYSPLARLVMKELNG